MGDSSGSALIIPLLGADEAVGSWRAALDPSAAAGVPAHVTIHFPWLPVSLVEESDLQSLQDMVCAVPRFPVTFRSSRWFGREVLWLDPDPKEPFIALAAESAARWPGHPQYGGRFDAIVPHLTVGFGDPQVLDHAEAAIERLLPIQDLACRVWWITRAGSQPWEVRRTLDLG